MNGIQRHSLSQHDSRILFARRFTKNRIKKCTFACMALAAMGYICPAKVNAQPFEKLVKPFLQKHCLECHGMDEPEADVSLSGITGDMTKPATAWTWDRMYGQSTLSAMPSSTEPLSRKITTKRLATTEKWLTGYRRSTSSLNNVLRQCTSISWMERSGSVSTSRSQPNGGKI